MRVVSPNIKSFDDKPLSKGTVSKAKQVYSFLEKSMSDSLISLDRSFTVGDTIFKVNIKKDNLNNFKYGKVIVDQVRPAPKKLKEPSTIIINPVSDDAPLGWGEPYSGVPTNPSVDEIDTRFKIGYFNNAEENNEFFPLVQRGYSDNNLHGNCSWRDPISEILYSWDGPLGQDVAPAPFVTSLTPDNSYDSRMEFNLGYNLQEQVIDGDVFFTTYSRATEYIYSEGDVKYTAPGPVLGFSLIDQTPVCICYTDKTKDSSYYFEDNDWIFIEDIFYPDIPNPPDDDIKALPRSYIYNFNDSGNEASTVIDYYYIDNTTLLQLTGINTVSFNKNNNGIVTLNSSQKSPDRVRYTTNTSGNTTSYTSVDSKTVIGVGYIEDELVEVSIRASTVSGTITSTSTFNGSIVAGSDGFATFTENFNSDVLIEFHVYFNEIKSDYLAYVRQDSGIAGKLRDSSWTVTFIDPNCHLVGGGSMNMSIDRNTLELDSKILFCDIKNSFCLMDEKQDIKSLERNVSLSIVIEEISSGSCLNVGGAIPAGDQPPIVNSINSEDKEILNVINHKNIKEELRNQSETLTEYPYVRTIFFHMQEIAINHPVNHNLFRQIKEGLVDSFSCGQVDSFGNLVATIYMSRKDGQTITLNKYVNIFPGEKTPLEVLGVTGDNQSIIKYNDGTLRRVDFTRGTLTIKDINRCIYKT